MKHFHRLKTAVLAVLLTAAAAPASATTVAKVDTEDLAHIADLIVVGKVESVVMKDEPAAPGHAEHCIYTHNAIRVLETWKGDAKPGDLIDALDVGGVVDGKGFDLDGTLGYQVGEKVLLFLQPRKVDPTEYLTLGLFLGKYTILDTSSGPVLAKIHLPMAERGKRFDVAKVPSRYFIQSTPLPDFEGKVKPVIQYDLDHHIDGKWLPKYDGMGVGR